MGEARAFIEKIRKEIEDSRSSRLWEDSVNLLSTVSESIFSRSAHFILELLQNAEDACSRIRRSSGEIRFSISPHEIRVTHNGALFTEQDVSSICGVRSSKKPEQETLGFLGIGFKSVFKVTDRPQVHSGGFHFKFDKGAFEDSSREPWQIIPIWVDEYGELANDDTTTFVLPFRTVEVYEQTLEALQKLGVHVFLFLKWLRELEVFVEPRGRTTVIKNLGEQDRIASISKNGAQNHFVIFRRAKRVDPTVSSDPSLEFYKRQNVREREIVLAFGVDNGGNLQRIEDASTLGSVVLPAKTGHLN